MFQTPHFRSDSWMAASTRVTFPQSERQDVVSGGGTSFQVIWRLPPLLPYVNKNLIKEGGILIKKKEEKVKKKKKEGKKEKITLCFLLKSTKCNIYRYHIDLDPGRGRSGPVKHREGGRRGQFKAGKGAQKPPPQPSLNPAYDYQNGGCSQAYPIPIPSQAGVTPS